MQVLRPLLRSCQPKGLGHVNGLPRCPPKHSTIRVQGAQRRHQHDSFGPHKEYFQTPGREPKPDLTPYLREPLQGPQRQSQPSFPVSPSASRDQPNFEQGSPAKPRGWLRVPRVIRSAIWFFTFLQVGFTAGLALVTWEYLSPPFEPGSPEEEELIEEIHDLLDTHPMVEELRESEWVEVAAFTPDLQHGLKGRNLVHQVLGGDNTQGIFMKVFHHPVEEYTMLVFFFGFGVEGWPDVIHGGIISTMLQEGLSKHIAYYYPGHFTTADNSTSIDFKKPCKPGGVYGILVAPSGKKSATAGNVHLTELQMTGLLVQLAGAPQVSSQFDYNSNTEHHTVSIPAQRGRQPTYAICQADVKIVPKQFNQLSEDLQIGAKDDGGFARALDFLKSMPEYKNSQPQPPPPPQEEEKKDED